jgi:hypothetical protein
VAEEIRDHPRTGPFSHPAASPPIFQNVWAFTHSKSGPFCTLKTPFPPADLEDRILETAHPGPIERSSCTHEHGRVGSLGPTV